MFLTSSQVRKPSRLVSTMLNQISACRSPLLGVLLACAQALPLNMQAPASAQAPQRKRADVRAEGRAKTGSERSVNMVLGLGCGQKVPGSVLAAPG